jgi:hypothetical protein
MFFGPLASTLRESYEITSEVTKGNIGSIKDVFVSTLFGEVSQDATTVASKLTNLVRDYLLPYAMPLLWVGAPILGPLAPIAPWIAGFFTVTKGAEVAVEACRGQVCDAGSDALTFMSYLPGGALATSVFKGIGPLMSKLAEALKLKGLLKFGTMSAEKTAETASRLVAAKGEALSMLKAELPDPQIVGAKLAPARNYLQKVWQAMGATPEPVPA